MPIFEIASDRLLELRKTKFRNAGIKERNDLQRLLRQQIEIISPDTLVIAEEFGNWTDSRRRIDLLGIDKQANLVVIELKRTEAGGHMELQAVRYAAMVSQMTFDQAVEAYSAFLSNTDSEEDAREKLLEFLEWDEVDEEQFGKDVRIVLASADFSRELTSAVLWLNDRDLDIRCFRIAPHELDGRTLVNVEQIVPVPEAADYQIRVKEKKEKAKSRTKRKWNEPLLFEELEKNTDKGCRQIGKALLDWVAPKCTKVNWGSGERVGGVVSIVERGNINYQLFRLGSSGLIRFFLKRLATKAPFDKPSVLEEFVTKMARIEGVDWDPKKPKAKPAIRIDLFKNADNLQRLKDAIQWQIDTIEKFHLKTVKQEL